MIKCLIIDTNPQAVQLLCEYVEKVPFLALEGSFADPKDAIKNINEKQIDLLIIDCESSIINGFEMLKLVSSIPHFILTSSKAEHAIEGFKANAVDFLLKPTEFDDFLRAIHKVLKQSSTNTNNTFLYNPAPEYLFVKTNQRIIRIKTDDIIYISGMGEYIQIYLENENIPITTLLSMKMTEEMLPNNQFMRVHRSYIVNLKKITEVAQNRIIYNKNTSVPIGDSYKDQFNMFIDQAFIGRSSNK